jgi:hypothetical protein
VTVSRLPLLALALLAACGHKIDPRLAPLANARLEAGVGLGDLRLGETTLGKCYDRFGLEVVSFIVTDDLALELSYEGGELALLFKLEPGRMDDEEANALKRATRDLAGYLSAYPHRRDLALASISVRCDEDPESTFYKGRLAEGVALFDPFLRSMGSVGAIPDDRAFLPMLAGLTPNTPREKAAFPARGLVLYGEREPKPDAPSRVTRMTVFLPMSADGDDEDAGEDEGMLDEDED